MSRVVVTGASGNIGSAVLREVASGGEHEVVGVARRSPRTDEPPVHSAVTWQAADVSTDDLVPVLRGVDAVVHLAWRFQPTHRPEVTWATNAVGTRRVLDAAAAAGVRTVVCASSVAAYSPVDHDDPVDESWQTDGASGASYCREKAYVERLLDGFEAAHPSIRVVRLRPAFVFQASASSEQRRIFGGVLARPSLVRRAWVPVVPLPAGLRLQAVHAGDVARAVSLVLASDLSGPLNLAGDGIVRRRELGELLRARTVEVPARLMSGALEAGWRTRALPVPGGLLDALMNVPVLSTARARAELGWTPHHTGVEALRALGEGLAERGGSTMPPLHR